MMPQHTKPEEEGKVKLLQLSGLARPLLTQHPSPFLTAARQQQWRAAKMIN